MLRVGRTRDKHRNMLKGWAPSAAGVIYFRPTNAADKKLVQSITGGPLSLRLGSTRDEAAETFARLIVRGRSRTEGYEAGTVGELCARARLEFLPSIEHPITRKERERHIDALEAAFGRKRYARNVYDASRDSTGQFLRAMDIQRHLFESKSTRPVAANREVRTWELVFIWARAPWGLTEYNPCSGLQANAEKPRNVLPDDGDIFKLYRWLDPPGRFMVALNRYYGRRKIEALGLMVNSAREDGLHLRRGKDSTSREIVILWDRRLRRMWLRLMRWREEVKRGGKVESTAAMLNRRGGRYTVSGFNSARRRAMERADLKGKFTFHDLRASRASTLSRIQATEVLAHDDQRSTRVYRRGAHIVDLTEEANSRKTANISRKTSAEK